MWVPTCMAVSILVMNVRWVPKRWVTVTRGVSRPTNGGVEVPHGWVRSIRRVMGEPRRR